MALERHISLRAERARRYRLPVLAAFAATVLAGCATQPLQLPEPVRPPSADAPLPAGEVIVAEAPVVRPTVLARTPTPMPPGSEPAASGLVQDESLPPLRGEPINANIEGIPVPAFINEFFGTILGVGIQMDPAVAKMTDLVTLRTPGPQAPADFYRLAVQVLQTYGVSTTYEGGRVLFTPSPRGGAFQPPLVLSGRALPSVPVTHRPVFQMVPLEAVRIGDVQRWLNTAFQSEDLQIIEDLNRNAIVLYGKPDLVRQAAEAVAVFDRPYMRGRLSTRLEPAFVGAEELARRLVDVLGAEGYAAVLHGAQAGAAPQGASIVVLPIPSGNTVILFAADAAVLNHAVEWARTIDQPNPTAGGDGLFYYRVRNTAAEEIVETLNGVRDAAASEVRTPLRETVSGDEASEPDSVVEVAEGLSPQGDISGGRIVLDAPRNAIIFQGASSDWGRLLPLIQQMDQAARQVMIEVTIAEVTLLDDEQFGVSWLANEDSGRFNGTVTSGTIGGEGVGGEGLTYLLDIAGQARARLQALAEDSRVTVLSTPRLLVKSGEEASIDVGTEVPIISSQTASMQQTEGNTNILQSVQYRKTGMILDIKPIVYSDNRIDLEIRQEVSNALPVSASAAVQSPSIFNRSVSTHLSLRDGSSVLIGGLMSRDATDSDIGVPYLKDIPLVGSLFETKGLRNEKRELVIMIVPYVVENDEQAVGLTRSLEGRFELLDLPSPGVVPVEPAPPVED